MIEKKPAIASNKRTSLYTSSSVQQRIVRTDHQRTIHLSYQCNISMTFQHFSVVPR